jgi:hypothetical protein
MDFGIGRWVLEQLINNLVVHWYIMSTALHWSSNDPFADDHIGIKCGVISLNNTKRFFS